MLEREWLNKTVIAVVFIHSWHEIAYLSFFSHQSAHTMMQSERVVQVKTKAKTEAHIRQTATGLKLVWEETLNRRGRRSKKLWTYSGCWQLLGTLLKIMQ